MGSYIVIDDVFVVDLLDFHVILGIQRLYSIWNYIVNYREFEFAFIGPYGKEGDAKKDAFIASQDYEIQQD